MAPKKHEAKIRSINSECILTNYHINRGYQVEDENTKPLPLQY
jgi:hypothetical protein